MALIISLSALLLSAMLIQVGSGSLGPLDALSGKIFGFSPTEIGLLGSAHFFGLFLGCFINPWLIRRSGHAKTFAMMAAASAISAILHPVFVSVYAWSLLRILTGFALAGAYTVIESWLQAKLNNKNRGQVFSIYRVVDMAGTVMAQGIIAALNPGTYVAYNIIAMIACMSLLPLALTQSAPPELPKQRQFKPFFALVLSPLAGLGVLATGLTNSAFRMVGPVYATEIGLDVARTALFLAVGVLGGALVQIPAGMVSDRLNRRLVIIIFSFAAILVCYATGFLSSAGVQSSNLGFVMVFLFGLTTIPIYSICAAHASDFASQDQMVDLSASLILIYAMGAIVSPILSGYLIDHFNAGAMFIYIGIVHTVLVLYSLWRMSRRPTNITTEYRYLPRTTPFISSFLRHRNRGR